MPWQLATPIATGVLDQENYDQLRITRVMHDSVRGIIMVDVEYGTTVSSVWVPGYTPKGSKASIVIAASDYTALVANSVANQGELTYDAVKRCLYAWLESGAYIPPGSVV